VSDEVPLTLYLEHLFGVESAKNINLIEKDSRSGRIDKQKKTYDPFLLSSFICATHFIECSRTASPFSRAPDEVLEGLYFCRTALIMPEDWKGADALIPVRSVGSSSSASKFSVILVQFKNRDRDANYPDSATRKRSSGYIFENQPNCHDGWKDVRCIRMYMHLGADTPQTAVRPPFTSHVTESDYALAAFGLSAQVYACLDFGDEDVGMGSGDEDYDVCAHMRSFLKPPEWLFPYAVSSKTDSLRRDDENAVPQMIWRHLRETSDGVGRATGVPEERTPDDMETRKGDV